MSTRIASIESFRVLAIFAVILWHSLFLGKLQQLASEHLLANVTVGLIWWVGVPYFCLSAGYFFGKSARTDGKPFARLRTYVTPLVWIFLAWLCVYTVIPNNWPAMVYHHGLWQAFFSETLKNLNLLATQPVTSFLMGYLPVWHLWFLPALMFSLAVLSLLAVCRLQGYMIPLIIILYLLGLTEEIAVGEHFLHKWSVAILCTALGWWLAGRDQPSMPTALCLIVGGYAFAAMEGEVMILLFHSTPRAINEHYFLGGIVLALGIFLLALAKPNLGKSTPLPFLAQFTFGVYVSHILVFWTLAPIEYWLIKQSPLWWFPVALTIYFLAVFFTVILSKVPIARYLVLRRF